MHNVSFRTHVIVDETETCERFGAMNDPAWFTTFTTRPEECNCVPVFCFPYAGGGPSIYRTLAAAIRKPLAVHAVHLPGRETRMRDKPFTCVRSLTDFLKPRLSPLMSGEYYMYGHSLGAVIAFDLARKLVESGLRGPRHLFIGARRAPHLSAMHDRFGGDRFGGAPLHTLSDDKLCEALLQYDGTRPEVFSEPELRELFLPILRADFTMVETYTVLPERVVSFPVTVFGGTRDRFVDCAGLHAWGDLTEGECTVNLLDEGHFFSSQGFERIARAIESVQAQAC